MGRKRRRHVSSEDRDHSSITSLLAPPKPAFPVVVSAAADLRKLQDRRRFSFDRSKQPVDDRAVPARVTMKPRVALRSTVKRGPGGRPLRSRKRFHGLVAEVQAFAREPSRIVHCLRRKVRREVMFALDLRRSGRGGAKRRNEWSDVHCK